MQRPGMSQVTLVMFSPHRPCRMPRRPQCPSILPGRQGIWQFAGPRLLVIAPMTALPLDATGARLTPGRWRRFRGDRARAAASSFPALASDSRRWSGRGRGWLSAFTADPRAPLRPRSHFALDDRTCSGPIRRHPPAGIARSGPAPRGFIMSGAGLEHRWRRRARSRWG